ncbi:MAG: hypothetical protein QM808_07820 [Steroidobacteraceae bacterium]
MNASARVRHRVAPTTADDLRLDHDDGMVESYTWLDTPADSGDGTAIDEYEFIDDEIDSIPTLHDVVEESPVSGQDDHADDQRDEDVFVELADASVEPVPLLMAGTEEISSAAESLDLDHFAGAGSAAAEQVGTDQANPKNLVDVYNLARRDPAVLQKALIGVVCLFQVIAGAALWHAVGDKVMVTALVPPMVYASIGVAAYLVGRRYLRIHFAQVRVGDKDWLLCEQVMVAADNGVMLKARFGTAYLIWEQLLGVAQDDEFYYLLIEATQGFKIAKQGVSDPALKIKLDDLASLTKAKAWQGN